jgi:hypothetical protein
LSISIWKTDTVEQHLKRLQRIVFPSVRVPASVVFDFAGGLQMWFDSTLTASIEKLENVVQALEFCFYVA